MIWTILIKAAAAQTSLLHFKPYHPLPPITTEIIAQFPIAADGIPTISTASKKPNYASLSAFQNALLFNKSNKLLPQALITLNLLHPSRLHPKLPAYAHINGAFDFNCTPLASPGMKILVHG